MKDKAIILVFALAFIVVLLGILSINSLSQTHDIKNNTITVSLNNSTNETNMTREVSTNKAKSTSKTKTSDDSSDTYSGGSSDGKYYDVVIPGSGGETVRAKHTGLSPEYGNRYVTDDGKVIYS